MSTYLTANDFLTGIAGTSEDFEIPGLGMIQIRSLSVMDVRRIDKEAGGDPMQMGLLMAQVGIVNPKLSAEQAARFQDSHPGILAAISKRISVLSGLSEDVEKKVGNGSSPEQNQEPQS